jgi:hypothetical protein
MEPLDLTKKPPRSPWAQVAGAYMLGRTIDKIRATLPGGNVGVYQIPGFSERLLAAIGCTEDELRDTVAGAKSEADVVKWLETRIDREKVERYNERASTRRIADVTDKEDFFRRYPLARDMSEEATLFEMLDKDDAQMFSTV